MMTHEPSVLELLKAAAEAPQAERARMREQVLGLGSDALLKLRAVYDHPDARVRVMARAWAGWIATPEDYASIEQSFDAPPDLWFGDVSREPPSRESVASDLLWPPGDVAGLIGELVMNRGHTVEEYELDGCLAALGQLHQDQPSELIEDLYLALADQPEMTPVQELLLHVLATDAPPNRERLRALASGPIPPPQALAISLMLEGLRDVSETPFPDSGGR